MRNRSERGPGGCPPGLQEQGPGCLENLQAENQELRTRTLICQEGLPQPSYPTPLQPSPCASDKTGFG